MVKLIEKCILLLILTYSLLLQTHFLQHSRHIWNGLAKLSIIRVLVTTYHLFFFPGQGTRSGLPALSSAREKEKFSRSNAMGVNGSGELSHLPHTEEEAGRPDPVPGEFFLRGRGSPG